MMAARLNPRHQVKCDLCCAVLALLIFLRVTLGSLAGSMRPAPSEGDKPTQAMTTPAPTETLEPEPVRHRDDIVSEGRLLPYELQEIMQDVCEAYGVPYSTIYLTILHSLFAIISLPK